MSCFTMLSITKFYRFVTLKYVWKASKILSCCDIFAGMTPFEALCIVMLTPTHCHVINVNSRHLNYVYVSRWIHYHVSDLHMPHHLHLLCKEIHQERVLRTVFGPNLSWAKNFFTSKIHSLTIKLAITSQHWFLEPYFFLEIL